MDTFILSNAYHTDDTLKTAVTKAGRRAYIYVFFILLGFDTILHKILNMPAVLKSQKKTFFQRARWPLQWWRHLAAARHSIINILFIVEKMQGR